MIQHTTPPNSSTSMSKASVFGTPLTVIFTMVSLLGLVLIGHVSHSTLLIPPIAATAAYIFGMPNIPGTQPRSVIGGHLIAGVIGIVIVMLFGSAVWAAVLAAGSAMFAMNIAKLFHIPSVATALFVVLSQPTHKISFMMSLISASVILSLSGYMLSRTTGKLQYPLYW